MYLNKSKYLFNNIKLTKIIKNRSRFALHNHTLQNELEIIGAIDVRRPPHKNSYVTVVIQRNRMLSYGFRPYKQFFYLIKLYFNSE